MNKNYREQLIEDIRYIRTETLAGRLPRAERAVLIEKATSQYALAHAAANDLAREKERIAAEVDDRMPRELPLNPPESALLDQLADLMLYEELSDRHPDKMTREEYPFMSKHQESVRDERQISFKWADEVGTDGREYRIKTRGSNRKLREISNGLLRDESARSRNKERQRKYLEFTKVQPVISYNLRDISGKAL